MDQVENSDDSVRSVQLHEDVEQMRREIQELTVSNAAHESEPRNLKTICFDITKQLIETE